MAGNLVKWWKHKILGGYKQFSVQECTTDSEELMYHQVRASSSCSAPPDLLLVSDRENNIPLRTPLVNIITTTTTTTTQHAAAGSNNRDVGAPLVGGEANGGMQSHKTGGLGQQHLQLQHQQSNNSTKDGGKQLRSSHKNNGKLALSAVQQQSQHQQHPLLQQQQQGHYQHDVVDGLNSVYADQHQQHAQHHQARHSGGGPHQSHAVGKEERIRLEEFTCDVSVEGGKSTQPLQFSFTFYDLDGHHGKITKDDIVGIVYTIYESIGKSVVVPHCGSKTINVRLTVSPEGKTKAAHPHASKLKRMQTVGGALGTVAGMLEHASALKQSGGGHGGHGNGYTRRQHRYRPRKLIKSDDEDEDSNSDKEATDLAVAMEGKASKSHANNSGKYNKLKVEQRLETAGGSDHYLTAPAAICLPQQEPSSLGDNHYENVTANLKYYAKETAVAGTATTTTITPPNGLKKCALPGCLAAECRGCIESAAAAAVALSNAAHASSIRSPTDAYVKQASQRVKMLRKARKQKYQDHCHETRQRSFSLGNESCWRNRHLQPLSKLALLQQQQQQQLHQSLANTHDLNIVDGVQLRHAQKANAVATAAMELSATTAAAQKRSSAECWKTALNRNDLISIIRESMEKNRLCFQMNGKPQANVSPIRQPQAQQQPHQLNQHSTQLLLAAAASQQQRQRSSTVSKIPTLIANHSNSIISPNNNNNNSSSSIATINKHHYSSMTPQVNNNNSNNSNNNNSQPHQSPQQQSLLDISMLPQHNKDNNSSSNNSNNSLYHPRPHIPIYHQQMAINPAVWAAQQQQSGLLFGASALAGGACALATAVGGHNKLNLCGYDSFLHATICGGATSHSPPPHVANSQKQQQQSFVATLQPISIMASATTVPNQQHQPKQQQQQQKQAPLHSTPKMLNTSQQHPIKQSRILRSGSYSQHQQQQSSGAQHLPQFHGYQRLSSGDTLIQQQTSNVAPSGGVVLEKAQVEQPEKWKPRSKKDIKNYDNSIYAQLSEKLQESALLSKHHRASSGGAGSIVAQQHTAAATQRCLIQQQQPQQKARILPASSSNGSIGTTATEMDSRIPVQCDPLECQQLLGQTTDEETSTELLTPSSCEHTALIHLVPQRLPEHNNAVAVRVETGTLVDLTEAAEPAAAAARTNRQGIIEEKQSLVNDNDLLDMAVESGDELGGVAIATGNSAANTSITSASSLIHRCVHEHIHHHYHHFEGNDE